MERENFTNTMSYLGAIYGKDFKDSEIAVWYDILKEYPEEVLNRAIKQLAKTEKFLPAIATIVQECDKYKALTRFEVLEYMRYKNYFKTADEYLKAKEWLERKAMPEWFKEDIKKYYEMILSDTDYIQAFEEPKKYIGVSNNNQLRIGSEENDR